jgi:hypothetical protein
VKQLTAEKIDVPWSIIFAISVSPQNKNELLQVLTKVTSEEPAGDSDLHKAIYTEI